MTIRWVVNSRTDRTVGKWIDHWCPVGRDNDLGFLALAAGDREAQEFLLQRKDGRTVLRASLSHIDAVSILTDDEKKKALGMEVRLKGGRTFHAFLSGKEGFI